jgi:hypothetical protein
VDEEEDHGRHGNHSGGDDHRLGDQYGDDEDHDGDDGQVIVRCLSGREEVGIDDADAVMAIAT